MQPHHLVIDDLAVGIEVGGVEQFAVLVTAAPPRDRGRQFQMAEIAAEGDMGFVGQAGVAMHGDAPFVLGRDHGAPAPVIQRF